MAEYVKLATAKTIERLERYINEYAYSTNYRINSNLEITNEKAKVPDSWFVIKYRNGYLFGRRTKS